MAREALETLAVCLALCPSAFDALHKDKGWQCFIIDLLLLCRTKYVTTSVFKGKGVIGCAVVCSKP